MPDWAPEIRRRLQPLRLAPTREAEIVDEIAQHLDDRWRELVAGGASAEEAARMALDDFSEDNRLARLMTPLRQARPHTPVTPGVPTSRWLRDLPQDLRYALRAMAARPGFTLVAVLSLTLGIGANTAIFGLWNGLLHASLPGVRDPEELVMLTDPNESGGWTGHLEGTRSWLTYQEFEDLRDRADAFAGMMATQSSLNDWRVRVDAGDWEPARVRFVSGGFFELLGVGPALGQVFTAADDRRDVFAAVLSHSYWQRRFGGRTDVIGRTLTIRTTPIAVAGVAARGFIGETAGQQPDFWLPLRLQPMVLPGRDRLHDTPPDKSMWLHVFARPRSGVTLVQAEAQANAIFRAGLESFYGPLAQGARRRELLDQRLELRRAAQGASPTRQEFGQSLSVVFAAVGVLLLIACANLANLLLARGTARRSEMALRLSLGASRARLARQLLTESLALAALGGALAIPAAYGFHAALVRMLMTADPRFAMSFGLDPIVLVFLASVTMTAALLFGAFPAWQVTRTSAASSLKAMRGAGGPIAPLRSARLLISLQLALSLPLLMGAGLLARTVYNLHHAELGFSANHLLLVRVDLRQSEYGGAKRQQVLNDLTDAVARVLGVEAVTFSQLGLFSGGESLATVAVDGYVPTADADRESALDIVGPDYFSTLGIPVRTGRQLTRADRRDGSNPCVINDAFARRFVGQANPLGRRITLVNEATPSSCEIVGVAGDAHLHELRGDIEPRFFTASRNADPPATPTLLIRTAIAPGPGLAAMRRAIHAVDAAIPILSDTSIEEQMSPLTARDRTNAQLAIVFGSVALALAAMGLFGVLSFGVSRRTGEIAVRMALGAQPGRVMAMILRETAGIVALGTTVGGALALSGSRLITSLLYGIPSQDSLTFVGAAATLVLVALAAACVPAVRASRVDPITALRQF